MLLPDETGLYSTTAAEKIVRWINQRLEGNNVSLNESEKSLFITESIPGLNSFLKTFEPDELQELVNERIIMADTYDLSIPIGYSYFEKLTGIALMPENRNEK